MFENINWYMVSLVVSNLVLITLLIYGFVKMRSIFESFDLLMIKFITTNQTFYKNQNKMQTEQTATQNNLKISVNKLYLHINSVVKTTDTVLKDAKNIQHTTSSLLIDVNKLVKKKIK